MKQHALPQAIRRLMERMLLKLIFNSKLERYFNVPFREQISYLKSSLNRIRHKYYVPIN